MKNLIKVAFSLLLVSILMISCKKDDEVLKGCTDINGDNYNANATESNNSCTFVKRFTGKYAGEFKCAGLFATVFNSAEVEIVELAAKTEVNILISSAIGVLPVKGVIDGNKLLVDQTLPNLKIAPGSLFPGTTGPDIAADGRVVTVLTISDDNKKLTGSLMLTLTTKEPTLIGTNPIPAGFSLNDTCGFVGAKK